jgi:hypothetical protein
MQAQAQRKGKARQAKSKSKRKSRYVIKVMNANREEGQVFWFVRTKGCPKSQAFSLSLAANNNNNFCTLIYHIIMHSRFKMEYR